jgi:hypothetical protein
MLLQAIVGMLSRLPACLRTCFILLCVACKRHQTGSFCMHLTVLLCAYCCMCVVQVREQRVSNLLQSLLVAACLGITPAIQQIPTGVLWGHLVIIFMFMCAVRLLHTHIHVHVWCGAASYPYSCSCVVWGCFVGTFIVMCAVGLLLACVLWLMWLIHFHLHVCCRATIHVFIGATIHIHVC